MNKRISITLRIVLGILVLLLFVAVAGVAVRQIVDSRPENKQAPGNVVSTTGIVTSTPPLPPRVADYSDVLVVVNDKSTASLSIADYFVKQRNIPAVNVAHVDATTSEEISDQIFQNLRSQIEQHMTRNALVDTINFIVTTKGVPLKVNRDSMNQDSGRVSLSASVESELSLIFSNDKVKIGDAGRVASRFYGANDHFSRAQYDMYLVTRLDAYTVDDVRTMIDNSGPGTAVPSRASFVLDIDPNPISPLPNVQQADAAGSLRSRGFNVVFDQTAEYLTGQKNVIGYVSWGSNDHEAARMTENAKPNNSWLPGALAVTYVSSDGRTFNWPPSYGQSLIADILREGAVGAVGNVYEPYSSALPDVSILFDRYTSGQNLAESFYAALPYLSWMEVVIGDPKTTITFVQ